MQTVQDKTVISGLRWYRYAYEQYGLLITVCGVGCVSGDFSQTVIRSILCNIFKYTCFILQHVDCFCIIKERPTFGAGADSAAGDVFLTDMKWRSK